MNLLLKIRQSWKESLYRVLTCDSFSFRCLGLWMNQLPLYVGPFYGKSIRNKLVCKFDEMENIISLYYLYMLRVTIDIYYHIGISFYLISFPPLE